MTRHLLRSSVFAACLGLFIYAGCATVDMRRPPGDKTMTIESKGWGVWFLSHKIASEVIQAQNQCSNGIAKIEASQSFGSIVGSIITLGLYSSMEITVTCAADDMSSEGVDSESVVTVPHSSDDEEIMVAFGQAVDMAVANELPAYVQFEGGSL